MEHARKMILLPQESVERLQTTLGKDKIKFVQTPGSVTSRLNAEMNKILNSPTYKDERETWSLYRQVLQRYLHFKGNKVVEKYKKVQKNDSAIDSNTIDNNEQEEEEEETHKRIDENTK